MKIAVCVKQVPGTTKVDIDEKTGVLLRSGVEARMNPYDLYALETALRIKEKTETEISVISMGPPQAAAVIKEAFWLGADKGFLVTDKRFAGADVLATSYTLSKAITAAGDFDLIICGKQTTDGDTAQVGPALAQWLGIPHAAWVTGITDFDEKGVNAVQDLGDSLLDIRMEYPCLITVEKDIFQPRLPSYKKMLESEGREAVIFGLDDIDCDETLCGLDGSPTKVERIFPPEAGEDRMMLEGEAEVLAGKVFELFREKKLV